MTRNKSTGNSGSSNIPKTLVAGWVELCKKYLAITSEDSFWRYSRLSDPGDVEQGWKLHISATVLTANDVLRAIGPALHRHNVLFKAPATLIELSKINTGIYYSYALTGKCFTVYPQSTEQAVALAHELHDLTLGIPAPLIAFDRRYKPDSCVHYRYGAFKEVRIEKKDGTAVLALRDPDGRLVPDTRESECLHPDWTDDPFQSSDQNEDLSENPLRDSYRVFRAITQRGKGGVYQAIDITADQPRLCIVKEGRKNGESFWDGRDGRWGVKNEEQVLRCLGSAGVNVPEVYSSFEVEGHYYLAIECLEGNTLDAVLKERVRRMSIKRALSLGSQIAQVLSVIHSAGWVWRDCKPSNLIVTEEGEVRPLDFEGACRGSEPDPVLWGTPAFVPAEANGRFNGESRLPEDLYALGVVLYYLLTAVYPERPIANSVSKFRRNVPLDLDEIILRLLNPNPSKRPSAKLVARKLTQIALSL